MSLKCVKRFNRLVKIPVLNVVLFVVFATALNDRLKLVRNRLKNSLKNAYFELYFLRLGILFKRTRVKYYIIFKKLIVFF